MFRRICLFVGCAALVGLIVDPVSAEVLLETQGGFEYEIEDYSTSTFSPAGGQLTRGGSEALGLFSSPFSDAMEMEVDGSPYRNPIDSVELTNGDREVVLNPTRISRLYVQRRVYVPAIVGEYARFIDTFRNPTNESITVTVEYTARYGFSSDVVRGTSSGDLAFSPADKWIILSEEPATQRREPVAFWFQNEGEVAASTATFSSGTFTVEFELTIPPLGQRALVSFALQAASIEDLREELNRIDKFPSDVTVGFDGVESDSMNMGFGGAPLIRGAFPYSVDEGSEVNMRIGITDVEQDSFTWSWDFDNDGVFGDASEELQAMLPAQTTDGPGKHFVGVRASDGEKTRERRFFMNVENLPPVLNAPPPIADVPIGQTYRWEIDATDPAGPADPLVYRLIEAPEGAKIEDGAVVWTPISDDRNIEYMFHLEIDDQDQAIIEEKWTLKVGDNRPPEPPTPITPINGGEVLEQTPTLLVANGNDPDGDPIVYRFRVDRSASFDSPDLIESADLREGADGETSWTVPKALERGVYYWQVRTFDGVAESAPRGGRFVYTAGIGALADGGVDLIDKPDVGIYEPRSECSLRRHQTPVPIFIAFGLLTCVLRRRR